ncbi:TPA: patatin-like phospholipase family protein [Legionella pneumophila]|uniref:patatin-like phospholipase family protein n=1 Tax=Legionella pneumophila TaxID=446 RepID=UPI0007895697|nr:patatin-like phospholipase family protein [Legionella pneumophila]HAU1191366.1 patatin-like phospholipase family protein [Legionella pneumophila]HBD7101460.1 patatin-like phospholipase family protein [Legionella pneumophila]HCO4737966.1 patatin-like phospholipase family protein [Legionella pneumophila]HDU7928464.1 patatin-like phospholipase family protein [Legionella pneumophila]HDU7934595.1 patatin-like phospholipase family protein [Legionella pneumophila]
MKTSNSQNGTSNEPSVNLGKLSTAKNLVFRGGGSKGVAYVGALQSLSEQGVLENIENVAGSSAGAMTAAIVACGGSAELMEYFCSANSFEDFVDNPLTRRLVKLFLGGKSLSSAPSADYSSVSHEQTDKQLDAKSSLAEAKLVTKPSMLTGLIASKGSKLVEAMEHVMRMAIFTHFPESLDNELKSLSDKLSAIEDKESAEYSNLANRKQIVEDTQKIINGLHDPNFDLTFGHLHTLHQYDPQQFKELYITGTDENGELRIFSHEKDADMPVSIAVRISASLPGAFDPVLYQGRKYIDGGAANNLPVNIFFNKEEAYTPGVVTTIGVSCENQLDITEKEFKNPSFMGRIMGYLGDFVKKILCKLDVEGAVTEQKREMLKYIDNGNLFVMVAPPISIKTAQMHIEKEEKEGVIKVGKAFCDMQLKSMIDADYKPQPFDEKTARVLSNNGEQQEQSIQKTIDFKSRLQNFKQPDRPWSQHVEKTIDRLMLVKGEATQDQIKLCLQWQEIKSVHTNPADRLREFAYAFLASPLAEPASNQQEINFSKETRKEINLLKSLPGLYDTAPDFTEEFNNQRTPSLQRA